MCFGTGRGYKVHKEISLLVQCQICAYIFQDYLSVYILYILYLHSKQLNQSSWQNQYSNHLEENQDVLPLWPWQERLCCGRLFFKEITLLSHCFQPKLPSWNTPLSVRHFSLRHQGDLIYSQTTHWSRPEKLTSELISHSHKNTWE